MRIKLKCEKVIDCKTVKEERRKQRMTETQKYWRATALAVTPATVLEHTRTMSIGQKRQREEAQEAQEAQEAPKNKTCRCGRKVSDTEVRLSSWTLGRGLCVQECSNCS
jgi:hypothetical protein